MLIMKNSITAIIIDDEQLDRELLQQLIMTYCKTVSIIGHACSVADGLLLYNQLKPNAVFLDIQMHGETGFEFISKVDTGNCKIIFTTGFPEYGIKALKAGAFDYLLKPIDVDELEEVEQKLLKHFQKNSTKNTITLLHKGEQQIVDLDNILYVEARGSYCEVVLKNETTITVSKNLKNFIADLSNADFVQIHRSIAANQKYFISYKNSGNEGQLTLTGNIVLPVSRSYKSTLLSYIK
jgi:two-component system, LytTR family, response regulator